ncbi:MAG: arginine deiminase-related protein, partial [Bacteroidota bacterium]
KVVNYQQVYQMNGQLKKRKQTTRHILMVRPANFGFNPETAESNAFQRNDQSMAVAEIKAQAITEFDAFVRTLRSNGIDVIVAEDSPDPIKMDAVFPNNWVTFHANGTAITYPMQALARRFERDQKILDLVGQRFDIQAIFNLESYEDEGKYLEGTGSMIMDRENQIVYACTSPRTHPELLDKFCKLTQSRKAVFRAVDRNGQDIYHTNVMMALGETFVVICLATIRDNRELDRLRRLFLETEKEIIDISLEQMEAFAGNMLQVRNAQNETVLVMSEQAYRSLNPQQIRQIERHTHILSSPIDTIETYGGGSARCMMAEIFLPEKRGE